jgi:acetoin utilization protein AcuB
MLVRDVMTLSPMVVEAKEKLRVAWSKLLEADVRHLPVVDDGKLVGIISERDIPSDLEAPTSLAGTDCGDRPVRAFMSSDVLSVSPGSEVSDAIDLMLENQIGALPVVALDGAMPVGIVSYVDVLRAARSVL